MGAIGIDFVKKKQHRDLRDFGFMDKEEEYSEMQDAELDQFDEKDFAN